MALGVGDNMSGLVWVMDWTSVLVILRIPKKKPGKIQENKEEEPRNKRSQTK